MALPDIKVECAFGTDPHTVPGAMDYTDITGSLESLSFKRGRENRESEIDAGSATAVFQNLDREFDPYPSYTAGSHGANVKPNRRIRVSGVYAMTDYSLIHYFPDKWEPTYPEIDYAISTAPGADGFKFLANNEISYSFAEALSGQRFVDLLDQAGYPGTGLHTSANVRAIDTGISTVTGHELEDEFVLEAIRHTAESVFGMAFMSRDGVFTFLDRQRHIHPNRSYFAPVGTVGDSSTGTTATTFAGAGLDDLSVSGSFSGTPTVHYRVQIDGEGTPDTFQWSDDGGATWNATGVAITGSAQTLNNGISVTFGATTGHTQPDTWDFYAGEHPYITIEPDTTRVVNRVRVTPASGNVQTAEDSASQTTYTIATKSFRASLLADDNDGLDFANRYLNQHKEPVLHFPRIPFYPLASDAKNDQLWPLLFSLDLGDPLYVIHRPPGGGSANETKAIVEGIEGEWNASEGWVEFAVFLSAAPVNSYWIYDDPIYSRYNTTTRYGY